MRKVINKKYIYKYNYTHTHTHVTNFYVVPYKGGSESIKNNAHH